MKVEATGPPPSLRVVRDLQLLHKAWKGPGELQGHFRARITPRQGLYISPLGKKLLTNRTGWSCRKDAYHGGDPAPPGDQVTPTSSPTLDSTLCL